MSERKLRRNMSRELFTTFLQRSAKKLKQLCVVQSELLVNLSFYALRSHYAYSIYVFSYYLVMRYFYEISSCQPRALVRSSHLHNAIKLRRLWYLNAVLCEARFAKNILTTSKLDYFRHKIERWVGSERLWRHINVTIEFYGDSKLFLAEFYARWEKSFRLSSTNFTPTGEIPPGN